MRYSSLFTLFAITSFSACAEFPELDAQITDEMRRANYPALASTDSLQNVPETRITPHSQTALAARISALRTRAARLRGSVVSPATKQRMRAPITISES